MLQIRNIVSWCIRVSLVVLLILLSSCSKKISPSFKYNAYLDDFHNFVINDSLRFIHKTYGNMDFPKSKKDLLSFLESNFPKANGVLLGADSKDTSNIKYAILLNPINKKELLKSDYYTRDTLMNGNDYVFISNQKWTLQGWDLENSFIDAFYVGEDYQKEIPGVFDFQDYCSQSITFLSCLKGYLDYPNLDETTNIFKFQFALTYSSFLGDNYKYDSLLKKYNSKEDLSDLAKRLQKTGVSGWANIKRDILNLSKDSQILMFSENHFKPLHRKTITSLLQELKKQGYNYLALEALAMGSDSLLNKGSNVLTSMGFYTREQNYVELIETAQNLGFTFVSYDDFAKDRELSQATNIFNKTIKKDPNAKVIVLAGFGHIYEGPISNGNQMMSGHLKSISGIDPLTISQTIFPKHNFKNLNKSLLLKTEEIPLEYRKKTDFVLIYPEYFETMVDQQSANFSYKNTNNFDIQLDFYRSEDLEHDYSHVKMPPIKSILVPSNKMIEIHLKPGNKYKYFVKDQKSITHDKGSLDL